MYSKMYQMTLFFKKVIYKKVIIYLILTKRYQIAPFFQIFLWEHASKPPLAKGMASRSCGYVQRLALTHANLHFTKKVLTPYQILYTFLAYMYKLIKDIKYKF